MKWSWILRKKNRWWRNDMENEVVSKNFIEQEIEKDLREGVYDTV